MSILLQRGSMEGRVKLVDPTKLEAVKDAYLITTLAEVPSTRAQ